MSSKIKKIMKREYFFNIKKLLDIHIYSDHLTFR